MNTRRAFLQGAGLAAGASLLGAAPKPDKTSPPTAPATASEAPLPLVKPRALKEGDTVGLVTPSSYIFNLWSIENAVTRLEALGLKTKISKNARGRHGYMGGTVKERVDDLHAMFADPSVAA